MTILLFIAVLFVLILVHEWGHYIVAKKTGMRVDEFGIGIPPRVIGVKWGETLFSFNSLPIGGFVRIYGEDPSLVGHEDPDRARAFGARPKWAQALVLIAGVTMNILFAWFLFILTFMIGVPTAVTDDVASPEAELVTSTVLPESPAETAGLGQRVTIVSVSDGEDTLARPNVLSFTEFLNAREGQSLSVVYRDGQDMLTTTLIPATGVLPDDPSRVGVGLGLTMVDTYQYGLFEAVSRASSATVGGLVAITQGLGTLLLQAFQGEADLSQVAGPVGIVGLVGDAAAIGLTTLLIFTATISLNLAIINLFPFPALDGGRLIFVAIEAVTGQRINPLWAGYINLVGFGLLLILMVLITYNDVLRLLN